MKRNLVKILAEKRSLMRKTNKIAVIVLFFAVIFGTEIASIIPDSSTAPIVIEAEPAEEPEDASPEQAWPVWNGNTNDSIA